ncbi:hypothetical protein LCGC14_1715550, partial [marine sediment metagenome]
IVDRTRELKSLSHWKDPGEIVEAAAQSFRLDRWEGQRYRVEVWIEKEALSGVIHGICEELDVPYFACKGYTSQSEMWRAAERMIGYQADNQQPYIIHLGDHDPSGIDMPRDIVDRQELFAGAIEVERIALNWNQIEEYSPPPNPTKLTDSRAVKYLNIYGDESWELDALEPRVIRDLIRETVEPLIDTDKLEAVEQKEAEYLDVLNNVVKNWETLNE